jgi:hypothetical protein
MSINSLPPEPTGPRALVVGPDCGTLFGRVGDDVLRHLGSRRGGVARVREGAGA